MARHIDVVARRPRPQRRARSTSPTSSGKLSDADRGRVLREPVVPRRDRVRARRDRRGSPHAAAPRLIVGVDPISLGVLAPRRASTAPTSSVGTTQPLGVHMNCGGGVGGFIATPRRGALRPRVPDAPGQHLLDTIEPGERGFGITLFEQTSYGSREHGKDWTGNSVYLWAIANAAYMALLGPARLRRARRADPAAQPLRGRAARRAAGRPRALPRGFFKEFVVDFDGTGQTVAEINARAARARHLRRRRPLGQPSPSSARARCTASPRSTRQADIDRLVDALAEVTA